VDAFGSWRDIHVPVGFDKRPMKVPLEVAPLLGRAPIGEPKMASNPAFPVE
jgi:hypothetical protein